MQFLSQSMGWADCILLAMAPLGIITTIVSAIRVGGPPWLKAIVGRSTENIHAAEMELMSSTSDEICELWNGNDVVRCQGSAPVLEFICAMPNELPENPAPNITINRADNLDSTELRLAALSGIIIQAGVLVYLAVITYLPTLRPTFTKDGRQVANYVFPITASGTVLLGLGMLLCAHVVDLGIKAQVVWLQREAIVSDQRFPSVALKRRKPFTIFKKSGREKPSFLDKVPIKTVIGTIISLAGFITQFIGIRGMHWSAPIAQLVAVALMTALRAWVRRGLVAELCSYPILARHELDWFTFTLGALPESTWKKEKASMSAANLWLMWMQLKC
ncbi:hypothetical protein HD806DRAFT_526912 [Xylariaceae sp. AK1471]|nr:hypothetical protein HD806DRAFT_526912 [Xylariaceae sp. AK1471]